MNFLAHFLLAQQNPAWVAGNFVADFTKGSDLSAFPPEIQAGIQQHRAIDHFTDNHPVVKQSARRLYTSHSKYAPVLVDVYYDYVLTLHWSSYAAKPLREFINDTYEVLMGFAPHYPEFLQQRLQLMLADDWLMQYSHLEGMQRAFTRMQRRLSRPELFDDAVNSLQTHLPALEDEFNAFFPELRAYVLGGDW